MSVDIQHPSPTPTLQTSTPNHTHNHNHNHTHNHTQQQPQPTLPTTHPTTTTSHPQPAPAQPSAYPLRDRSTLVRPERDLPGSVAGSPSSSGDGGDGGGGGGGGVGGRKEKFLDQFLTSVASFPAALQARLARMRELDEACVVRMREMDECSKQHVHNIRRKWKQDVTPAADASTASPASSAPSSASASDSSAVSPSSASSEQQPGVAAGPNAMSVKFGLGATYDIEAAELHLRGQRDELLRLSRAKQTLASECYEGVDGHIRRLDVSLRKYETKLRKGTFDVSAQPVDRRKGTDTRWDAEGRAMAAEVAAELKTELDRMEGTGGGRRVKARSDAGGAGGEGAKGEGVGGLGEPTYCLCHKVSFGQMVACDNDDCEIEWFHFACVGLESKPRGKWLCPQCREGKKKKIKKDK